MKRAIGIINLHSNPKLDKLTEKRPLGAVTFLGRYGIIDFVLSNFSNSDVNKIEILVEHNIDGIRAHISNGGIWISNTKTGFIRSVINEDAIGDKNRNTDIANIFENIPESAITEDYVIVASPHFITSIDYRDVLRAHGDNDAGITIVYAKSDDAKRFVGCDKLLIDDNDNVLRNEKIEGDEDQVNVSIESYVFSKEVFLGLLRFSREISNTKTTLRKMIDLYTNNRMTKVFGYEHKNYIAPILSLNAYINESMKLLDIKNRRKLFLPDWPVYTTTHNTPPAQYGENAEVSNSFIANGAVIKGKVVNSIISREVIVNKDAVVKDCILFNKTDIGEGVHLQQVVTDKNVIVRNVKNLKGDGEDYLLIAKGANI